jgi:hypothetical protein
MPYTLSLQKVNGDMLLIGTNRRNPFAQPLVIGHTGGITDGWHYENQSLTRLHDKAHI